MDNPEIVPINDIDQFAFLVANWHANRLGQLQQALAVPDEVEIACDFTGSGVDTPLTAEQRVAFKAGLIVAMDLFKELPFTVTPEPDAEESPATEQSQEPGQEPVND